MTTMNMTREMLMDNIQVRIIPFQTTAIGKNIRAYVELTIAEMIVIRGTRIIESNRGGLFISFPSLRTRDGQYKDIVIIRDREFRELLRTRIMQVYKNDAMNEL